MDWLAVFDPIEIRAWGPFKDNGEAMRFIESDKYLESWCVVWTKEDVAKHKIPLYHPTVYDPTFPGGLRKEKQ